MAHEIDFSLNRPAFAFDARDGVAWHGLGTAIPAEEACDPRAIAARAGAAYTVRRAPVRYRAFVAGEAMDAEAAGRDVLYRDDTGRALGVVSDGYAIHQPAELFEVWRDELRASDLYITSAGVLKGGRVVFVCARVPDAMAFRVGPDLLLPFVTIATSFDGSMATIGRASTIRTVCANTLAMNLADKQAKRAWQAHRGGFDGAAMKRALGLLPAQIKAERETLESLAARKVTPDEAFRAFMTLAGFAPDTKPAELEKGRKGATLKALATAYVSAPGAGSPVAMGTAWGILNAATYHADHAARVRDTEAEGAETARLFSSQLGAGAEFKAQALELALALAA